jgi:hypothetical protein
MEEIYVLAKVRGYDRMMRVGIVKQLEPYDEARFNKLKSRNIPVEEVSSPWGDNLTVGYDNGMFSIEVQSDNHPYGICTYTDNVRLDGLTVDEMVQMIDVIKKFVSSLGCDPA